MTIANPYPIGPPPPAPPAGWANVLITMNEGGPLLYIETNGPAHIAAVYGNGAQDGFVSSAAGLASFANFNPAPTMGTTPQPSDPENLGLGSALAPGPGGIANIAVFFTDSGLVRGMQFNGPAIVSVVNTDGSFVQAQNALPSGTPTFWLNPSGT